MVISDKKIGIVVPAYNEQELISKSISSIPAYVDHIILVDDCSSDKTIEIVENLNVKNVFILKHDRNYGVGRTIATGYKQALALGCDVVAVMGGDAQMDPEDLEGILAPVLSGEVNYSKGNRFIYPGNFLRMPKLRIIGNTIFSIMSCIASGYYHIFDTQCGFTAIDSRTLSKMDLDELFPEYGFPTDMLAKLNMISATVLDVPVKAIYATEKSGIRVFSYTMTIITLTITLFCQRQFDKIRKKTSFVTDY